VAGLFTDRYSRPISRLWQCGAVLRCGLMTTITFLGERQDIIDPDAAVTAARQTTEPVNSNKRNHPQPASPLGGNYPLLAEFDNRLGGLPFTG
jgi:hypothetical protein